jgi:hypothetical protein
MMAMHMAYGLDMIALTSGTGLLVWSMKNPGRGSWLGKLIGALVMIFSIVCIVCMFSCAMKGGECHSPAGEGMMMGAPGMPMPGEEMHEHEHMKKGEHKKS